MEINHPFRFGIITFCKLVNINIIVTFKNIYIVFIAIVNNFLKKELANILYR